MNRKFKRTEFIWNSSCLLETNVCTVTFDQYNASLLNSFLNGSVYNVMNLVFCPPQVYRIFSRITHL